MQRQKPDPQDDLWSTAWAIEFGEQRFQVIKEDMYEEGMEKGIKIGMKIGMEIGMEMVMEKCIKKGMQTFLLQLIHSKYHIDAHDWIETLTEEDCNRIPNLLITCDTFEQLTQKMNHTE